MLTIRTKVFEPGSKMDKLNNFLEILYNPRSWGWMKKLYEKIQVLKNNGTIQCYVSKEVKNGPFVELDRNELDNIQFNAVYDKDNRIDKITFKYKDTEYVSEDRFKKHTPFIIDGDRHVFIYEIGLWYNIEKQIKDLTPMLGYYYFQNRIVINRWSAIKYNVLNFVYKTVSWLSLYKLFHTLDSIYLCLKYPFLYPRNRFTGLHYNNWNILDKIKELNNKAHIYLTVKFLNDENYKIPISVNDTCIYKSKQNDESDSVYTYLATNDGRELILNTQTNSKYGLKQTKKSYTYNAIKKEDGYYIYDCNGVWRSLKDVFVPDSDVFKTNENGEEEKEVTHFYTLVVNEKYKMMSNILSWFHNYVLGFIFCIPTYNELDALDKGWMRKFGIRLCDDVKAQLKKDNMLYSFRITQIKEKFGGLRFYFSHGSRDMYDLISRYESESYKTCITCGRDAKYMTKGWISPYCENCISNPENATEIK